MLNKEESDCPIRYLDAVMQNSANTQSGRAYKCLYCVKEFIRNLEFLETEILKRFVKAPLSACQLSKCSSGSRDTDSRSCASTGQLPPQIGVLPLL